MANVHVLEQVRTDAYRVVMHIAIPNANNPFGMGYRAIIARVAGTTVLPDGDGTNGTISAAEKAQVVAGSVYEHVTVEKGQTVAGMAAQYTRRSSEVLAELQARYAQYGRTI